MRKYLKFVKSHGFDCFVDSDVMYIYFPLDEEIVTCKNFKQIREALGY